MSGLQMKYFVLKPKGDDIYAEASRKAMRAYASHIERQDPDFCKEIRDWADAEWSAVTPHTKQNNFGSRTAMGDD